MENFTNFSSSTTSSYTDYESSSVSYTGYIVGACIFIAVTVTGIIIKIKCEGASQLFEFINAFK